MLFQNRPISNLSATLSAEQVNSRCFTMPTVPSQNRPRSQHLGVSDTQFVGFGTHIVTLGIQQLFPTKYVLNRSEYIINKRPAQSARRISLTRIRAISSTQWRHRWLGQCQIRLWLYWSVSAIVFRGKLPATFVGERHWGHSLTHKILCTLIHRQCMLIGVVHTALWVTVVHAPATLTTWRCHTTPWVSTTSCCRFVSGAIVTYGWRFMRSLRWHQFCLRAGAQSSAWPLPLSQHLWTYTHNVHYHIQTSQPFDRKFGYAVLWLCFGQPFIVTWIGNLLEIHKLRRR